MECVGPEHSFDGETLNRVRAIRFEPRSADIGIATQGGLEALTKT
jgi:hypothetical protein